MNKNLLLLFLSFLVCLGLIGCQSATIRYISVDDLKKSLPKESIAVGFDVDDTLLFSSPGMFYGVTNTDGKNGTNIYGENPTQTQKFFNDWTEKWDAFSMPKKSARELLTLHTERGDSIYFITARPYTGTSEKLTERIKHFFHLEKANPVIFNGFKTPKTLAIQKHDIKIYYGDADTDITDAQAANIRPIRVLRPTLSIDERALNYGAYGEEVLLDSEH